jgi:hypothetical protein
MLAVLSLDSLWAPRGKVNLDPLLDYVPRPALRRLGHYERLGLLSALRCLEKAAADGQGPVGAPQGMGLVIATCYGPVDSTFAFLDSALDSGQGLASPTAFTTSVYNILSTAITIHAQVSGPALSISQRAGSLSAAVLQAGLWLKSGRADYVLLGAVDQYSACLDFLINELNDPGIMPTQEVALFMLLADAARESGRYTICEAGYGLGNDENIAETLDGKRLQEQMPAPCGPVHSLLQALGNTVAGRQRCGLALPGYGFSYVDIIKK